MKTLGTCLLIGTLTIASLGCATKTKTGAAVGAGAGGVIGAIIGKQAGNTAVGAALGAVVGGATGAAIGHYMDNQADELEQDLAGAKIERVGEGIKVTFDSGILFDVNQTTLKPEAQTNLVRMATILQKYGETNILIEGHTDADGTDEHNQGLSERRAAAVKSFLAAQSVAAGRMSTMGYGESMPVADNTTSSGKALNRRVELAIIANEDLKKRLESQG